jgi:predicted nucleic acid-binding protein
VWFEVQRDPAKAGAANLLQAQEDGVLTIVQEGDPAAYPQLDEGESSVLSAAAATGAAVIIDERKARALMASDPDLRRQIRASIGVVGLVVLAKRNGLISLVRPLLDEQSVQGFRMSSGLYQAALEAAGEAQ